MFHFCTPWKQESPRFFTFSGVIEMGHLREMGKYFFLQAKNFRYKQNNYVVSYFLLQTISIIDVWLDSKHVSII